MEIKPNYYDCFCCVASECKHNCCIGWEIDIDDDTLKKYNSLSGKLKTKLDKSISLSPCAHFVLTKGERCPFLNEDNLCELILHGTDDMLCEICKEHPRFYNSFDGVVEKGLGLCCEEAARVVLTHPEPFRLLGNLPESDFFKTRNEIFSILQNREKPLNRRIDELLEFTNVSLPINEVDWISVFKRLERLDKSWDEFLNTSPCVKCEIPPTLHKEYEHLICYFIYRHLSDDYFSESILFSVLSCYVIATLNKSQSIEEMLEIARMYSAEVEYSNENMDLLFEILSEYNN
jgi:lysine-N-methylase